MEIFLRLYSFIAKILSVLITPFLYLAFDVFGKHGKLPPLQNPQLEICAVDLAEKIRNREVNIQVIRWCGSTLVFMQLPWSSPSISIVAIFVVAWAQMQLLHTLDLHQGIPLLRILLALLLSTSSSSSSSICAEVYWPQIERHSWLLLSLLLLLFRRCWVFFLT